jgi:hypothetical protein
MWTQIAILFFSSTLENIHDFTFKEVFYHRSRVLHVRLLRYTREHADLEAFENTGQKYRSFNPRAYLS